MVDVLRRSQAYLKARIRAALDRPAFDETIAKIERAAYCENDLRENEALLARFSVISNLNVQSINWFIPYIKVGYAGIRTILAFMDYFNKNKGVQNRVIVCDKPGADPARVRSTLLEVFPNLQKFEVIVLRDGELDLLPACDAAVATLWSSAYQVLKFKRTTGKFYFVQDYEPLFYPAGSLYALAEASYRFGFHAIINSPGLWEFYKRKYSTPSTYFTPALDTDIFYPPASRTADGKFRLFFYGRLGASRNAYEIGIAAIQRLKKEWGDRLQVYVAGSPYQLVPRSSNISLYQNLGLLPYTKTADLYRICDAGLVFMLTQHCSYIPLELMGCGAAVVSNWNDSNLWLYRNGENCLLSEPSVPGIVENINRLITDPSLTKRLAANGHSTVTGLSWEPEMEKVFNFMCRRDEH